MKPSDRYLKLVEWSEEDGSYVGTCPGLMLGGVHGDNEADVYKELCEVVNEWIEIHGEARAPLPAATANKDYSGKFLLRLGKDLHRLLAVEAAREEVSLNSYCLKLLAAQCGLRGKNQGMERTSPRKSVNEFKS